MIWNRILLNEKFAYRNRVCRWIADYLNRRAEKKYYKEHPFTDDDLPFDSFPEEDEFYF